MENLLGQTVFARWKDGYYYPAMVDDVLKNIVKVSFLDGSFGIASSEYIVELQEAFQKMQLEGNWKNHGVFYKGRLNHHEPMTMYYNDGDVEQLELKQLRGVRPGEPVVWKQIVGLSVAGVVAGIAIYKICKAIHASEE